VVDVEHEKELALTELRTDKDVLEAKLGAEKKSAADREADFDKELKMHKDRFTKELARLSNLHDRDIQQREQQAKTQDEAYKYKVQYLELSQQELRAEKTRFQDKERDDRKKLVTATAQLRELKSKHKQAVDLHEAFRQHVESRDATRAMESSGWDVKKQSLLSEQKLALQQVDHEHSKRRIELEAEVERLKGELEDSQLHVKQLSERLAESDGGSGAAALKAAYTYSGDRESKAEVKAEAPAASPVAAEDRAAEAFQAQQEAPAAEAAPPAEDAQPPADAPPAEEPVAADF